MEQVTEALGWLRPCHWLLQNGTIARQPLRDSIGFCSSDMDDLLVRLARSSEAAALTKLAMTAKASWGYSDAFMQACRAKLTITPAKMATWIVWVAQLDATICGMIALNIAGSKGDAELEDFFVHPSYQGRGIGRALMSTVLRTCQARSVRVLRVDADPNAEQIYQQFGFATVGRSPSRSISGRTLPRMELRVPESGIA
jgi:GNAT superfamily N-acetyltransferase